MMAEPSEHRYPITAGTRTLFVRGSSATGWQVWLNIAQDFDGVQLAFGSTRDLALTAAVEVLLEGVRTLRALVGDPDPDEGRVH
jgi:hypothetical protein